MHNNISKQISYDDFIAKHNITFDNFYTSDLFEAFHDVILHEFQLIHLDDFKDINEILCKIFNTKVLEDYIWNEPLDLSQFVDHANIKDIIIHVFDDNLIRACELLDAKQRIKFLNNKFTPYNEGETIKW